VSFVLLSFKHAANVERLCYALGCSPTSAPHFREISELIVVEDGGGEARQLWRAAAASSKGHTRVVESNNLHEIRAYRRGFELAKGTFLVMLQDDDIPPPLDFNWLAPALRLFELHPGLGLVSCTDGFTSPELFGEHYGRALPIVTMDERLPDVPFMFVVGANSAPVVYRAAAYRQVKGLDTAYSRAGEPGIGFETEISLRLWGEGWQSGIMNCGNFQRGVGGHATLQSEGKRELRKAVWAQNQQRMNATFPLAFRRKVSRQVVRLNSERPLVHRPKAAICTDLRLRMRRKVRPGEERVSRKGAKMVEPLYEQYKCGGSY